MDVALNNLQRLICHKTQPNKQPTQHYKVRIKSKVERNPGNGVTPPLHLRVVGNEKGASGSPSTTVPNFTIYIYIYIYRLRFWYKFSYLQISIHINLYEGTSVCKTFLTVLVFEEK